MHGLWIKKSESQKQWPVLVAQKRQLQTAFAPHGSNAKTIASKSHGRKETHDEKQAGRSFSSA